MMMAVSINVIFSGIFLFFLAYFCEAKHKNGVYNLGLISAWDHKCPSGISKVLKPGDLLEFDRKSYRHWSVYAGEEYVFQYNGEDFINLHKNEIAKIPLKTVINGSRCRINNGLDKEKPPLKAEQIVKRANSRLGERKYHLVNNNCEHFAKWARNDHHYSAQAKILDLLDDYTLFNPSNIPALKNLGMKNPVSWGDAIRAGVEILHQAGKFAKDEL